MEGFPKSGHISLLDTILHEYNIDVHVESIHSYHNKSISNPTWLFNWGGWNFGLHPKTYPFDHSSLMYYGIILIGYLLKMNNQPTFGQRYQSYTVNNRVCMSCSVCCIGGGKNKSLELPWIRPCLDDGECEYLINWLNNGSCMSCMHVCITGRGKSMPLELPWIHPSLSWWWRMWIFDRLFRVMQYMKVYKQGHIASCKDN